MHLSEADILTGTQRLCRILVYPSVRKKDENQIFATVRLHAIVSCSSVYIVKKVHKLKMKAARKERIAEHGRDRERKQSENGVHAINVTEEKALGSSEEDSRTSLYRFAEKDVGKIYIYIKMQGWYDENSAKMDTTNR